MAGKQNVGNPNKKKLPTESELELLAVLWRHGKATVREVFEAVKPTRNVGYTTVLKLLQIMAEKGLVVRDERARTHVYSPSEPPVETRRRMIADLLHRAFGGSRASFINALFDSDDKLTREDFLSLYEQVTSLRQDEGGDETGN